MLRLIVIKTCICMVKLYQYLISPILPKACRFLPTCSDYTIEAIKTHGPFRGTLLGIRRILSCHPFSKKSGIDNVPIKNK